jgi:ABC-2 type transport system ATP-binding protein
VILVLVVLAGLVWWFASHRSTNRRHRTRRDTRSEAALAAPTLRPYPRPLLVGPPARDVVIEMIGVTKLYGRGRDRRPALDELDLSIPSGGVFGVLGQNGAGKTTALRCLLGLVRPTAGTCRVLGVDSGDLHSVIGRIGGLIETPGLAPTLSGRRNLALLARLDRIGPSGVERALHRAGLAERADDPVATYSLGMRQRLGIAASLLRDPDVVILDEPANGLDPAGIAEIRELLIFLAAEGRTVVVSSHLLGEVERTCNRVAVIDGGRCVAAGQIGDLLATAGAATLIVGVGDLDGARCALMAAGIDATVAGGALKVSWPVGDAAHVTEVLASKGLFVSELRHEQPSLEAVFFGLTSKEVTGQR